ncbi:hypothetical protein [Amycolatopsis taiwanensis]|uniref:hypothetical protein n=1 Tax=Amycolatopsis taiwanensis TaxID=342230 RepID=UPI002554B51D|nr:hypothetical protein [Amycolatopsis taiwanensis]
MHGWEGWVGLAKGSTGERQAKRRGIEETWAKYYKLGSKRSNAHVRGAVTDFARLELAGWLASRDTDKPSDLSRSKSESRRGDEGPAGTATAVPGEPIDKTGVEPAINQDSSAVDLPRPSPIKQVETLAQAMTAETVRRKILTELAIVSPDATEAARQLANHGWCDLFLGLVQVVEKYKTTIDKIPEWGKRIVKQALRDSSIQAKRPMLTDRVIDMVVDNVWSALKGAATGEFPLLGFIDSKATIRSLRILAVFSCPAPEDHDEVREHALKPLADEVAGILTEKTKEWLAKLFKEWMTGEAE